MRKGLKKHMALNQMRCPFLWKLSFTRVRVFLLLSVLMIVMGFVFKPLVRIVGKPYIPYCDIKKLID